jgi:putative intracellular protease/amidase
MLSQGTLGRSDSIFAGSPGWLRDGNIVITAGTAAEFNAWYRANDQISVAGNTLSEWTQWAAANNKLPATVCGSSVSASALQRQVFGKDPAAGNPWVRERKPAAKS